MKKSTNEVPVAKMRKVRFYTKASFPWAIIFTVLVLASGFAAGWHSHQAYEQDMQQSYLNGKSEVANAPKE